MRSLALMLATLAGLCVLTGCEDSPSGPAGEEARSGPPRVLTTFYPTTYFTDRIAGALIELDCPLPADADPIFWKPDPEVVRQYQEADLIVVNGAQLEKWVFQVSLPQAKVVNTAEGFESEWLEYSEAVEHKHGPEGDHSHAGIDGHTWLDPVLAIAQSRAIAARLEALLPDSKGEIQRGLDGLVKDLQELDARLKALSFPDGQYLYCSHPAYNYLARRYGWKIQNLDLDPEAVPADKTLAAIRESLESNPGTQILWESVPIPAAAQALGDLGLQSRVISPCETSEGGVGGGDYLGRMRANVAILEEIGSSGKR